MKRLLLGSLFVTLIFSGCSINSGKLTLKGDIQNNIVSQTSTAAGRIMQMNKQQGEPVKKGDIIAVIDNTNQKYAVDQLQAVVDMKKAKLDELQAGTRPQQIEQAQAQVRGAKAQLDLLTSGSRNEQIEQAKNNVSVAEEAYNSARITYDYVNTQYNNTLELFKEGGTSQSDVDNAKYKLDTAEKQVNASKYQLEAAKQQLALLENGSTSQTVTAARANYDAANAQLKLLKSGSTKQAIEIAKADLNQSVALLNQAQNNLDNCNITALEDGIIISKNYDLGDVVNMGSNIADIAVKEDIYILSYIPDKYLDKVSYNQEVKVTTSTGVQVGRINYIALQHEYTPKDKQSTSDTKHTATKIKIAIKSDGGRLKSGMIAKVEIPLK